MEIMSGYIIIRPQKTRDAFAIRGPCGSVGLGADLGIIFLFGTEDGGEVRRSERKAVSTLHHAKAGSSLLKYRGFHSWDF